MIKCLERHEAKAVILLSVFLFMVNLVFIARYPVPWVDEVSYADPAVRFVSGQGWTSIAWVGRDCSRFWAANVPLYSMALVPWLSIFGTGIAAVRSFNLVLVPLILWCLWLSLRNAYPTWEGRWRLLFIGLIGTADGIMFAYRMGRPDTLCLLLIVLMACMWTRQSNKLSFVPLLFVATLMPWAGLQMLPPLAVLLSFLLLIDSSRHVKKVVLAATGIGMGLTALFVYLKCNGVWSDFLGSISPHVGLHHGFSLLAALRNSKPAENASIILMVTCGVLVCTAFRFSERSRILRHPALIGLAIAIAICLAVGFSGKDMRTYYGFMPCLPLTWGLCATAAEHGSRWSRIVILIAAFAVVVSGFGKHIGISLAYWTERDPAPFADFLKQHLREDDVIYTHPAAYYALTASRHCFYTASYMELCDELPHEVNVVVSGGNRWIDCKLRAGLEASGFIPQESFEPKLGQFGLLARKFNQAPSLDYRCTIFRRKQSQGESQ